MFRVLQSVRLFFTGNARLEESDGISGMPLTVRASVWAGEEETEKVFGWADVLRATAEACRDEEEKKAEDEKLAGEEEKVADLAAEGATEIMVRKLKI